MWRGSLDRYPNYPQNERGIAKLPSPLNKRKASQQSSFHSWRHGVSVSATTTLSTPLQSTLGISIPICGHSLPRHSICSFLTTTAIIITPRRRPLIFLYTRQARQVCTYTEDSWITRAKQAIAAQKKREAWVENRVTVLLLVPVGHKRRDVMPGDRTMYYVLLMCMAGE